MHYCPECRYEYKLHVTVCPDCGTTLVDGEMPDRKVTETVAQSRENEADAVILLESSDYLKLRFLQDLLEQEGIPFSAKKYTQYGGVETSTLYTGIQFSSLTVGGLARIFVAPGDFARAKELLKELEDSKPIEDEDTPSEEEK